MASKIKKGIIDFLSNIKSRIYPYNAISEADVVKNLQDLSEASTYENMERGFNRTLNELYEYDKLEKWYYDEDEKSLVKYDDETQIGLKKPKFWRIADSPIIPPYPDKTYRRYIIKSKIYCNNKAEDIQAHTFVDSDSNYNEDEIRTALLETVLVFLQSKEDLCGGGGMFDKSETGDLSIYNIKNHFGFDSPDETDSYDVLYPEIDVS
jgi:hypothetical protein